MAWIESHQAIGRHPKTARLARSLGVSKHEAIGVLHCLWWWAFDYAPEGNLAGFDPAEIADGCLWEGEPGHLLTALISAGWIDEDRRIHDWYEYAGKYVEKRAADAARKREARRRTSAETPRPTPQTSHINEADIQRTSSGHPTDVAGTNQQDQPTNQPTRSSTSVYVSAAPPNAAAAAPADAGDVLLLYCQVTGKKQATAKERTSLRELSRGMNHDALAAKLRAAMDRGAQWPAGYALSILHSPDEHPPSAYRRLTPQEQLEQIPELTIFPASVKP